MNSVDNNEYSKTDSNNKITLPGINTYNKDLLKKISNKRTALGSEYKPRTKHLNKDGKAKFTNRLILESSPYLLQHAHNPVNWFPWSEEPFALAKKMNRPILLSVGYSTCHWCHVMEEESFEDIEIAKTLNEKYIAIKVDREERPDIDSIYMAAVRAMTGRGGWPMTLWLTPEGKPLYGASYIPARDGDRGVKMGFLSLLNRLNDLYHEKPDDIVSSTEEISTIVSKMLDSKNHDQELPTNDPLKTAADLYIRAYDNKNGGLLGNPKFPSSLPIRFLLREYKRTKNKNLLEMAELTLSKMAEGGIYDHIAGGFHRYSTDNKWLVPHFEKMLYDNALLATSYIEAYQLTKKSSYANTAKEILDYILKDMTSKNGGFYSATDADSIGPSGHREEGYFFTWTEKEISAVLTTEESKLFNKLYNVTPAGNFEHSRSILNITKSLEAVAVELNISLEQATKTINLSKLKLYKNRKLRPLPIRDEKIITAWNGLMISALAKGAFVFNRPEYMKAATKAASFILDNMIHEGKLKRIYKDGISKHSGFLDDYAFFISGLIDLYETTSDIEWLSKAIALDKTLNSEYEDQENGGFFMTGHSHEKLLAREKPFYDGAEPSGNSVAIFNLLRLGEFTTIDSYRARAVKGFKATAKLLTENPSSLSELLLAWNFYKNEPKEIVIVLPENEKLETAEFVSIMKSNFIPNKIISIIHEGEMLSKHSLVIPLLKGKTTFDNLPTAFVCTKGVCLTPTTKIGELKKQLQLAL